MIFYQPIKYVQFFFHANVLSTTLREAAKKLSLSDVATFEALYKLF